MFPLRRFATRFQAGLATHRKSFNPSLRSCVMERVEPRRLLSTVPRPDHLVIVVEENHSYSEVIGNLNTDVASTPAPYINSLARSGALFTDSHSNNPGSLPNYLDLFCGSTRGITGSDANPQSLGPPDQAGELIQKGLTFTGFADSLPYVGYNGIQSGAYVRHHAPWVNFNDVPGADNVPFTQFPTDFTKLPTVAWVVPDLNHDMHDGTILQGDTWLKDKLGAYITWAKTHNSLLIVTFDEDDGSTSDNHIPTFFYGATVKTGVYGETFSHLSVLRTVEDMYDLPPATDTGYVITDVWNSTTSTVPAAPSNLTGSAISGSQIKLTWSDNSTNETSFKIDRATNSAFTQNLAALTAPANGSSSSTFTDSGLSLGVTYYYRIRATNSAGDSSVSNTASATTASSIFLCDLAWTSATNGWGPVEKDTSNGSSGAGDGRTITLNGVTYAKGLGAHANSQIVYNLNGAYSSFLSDIGIDDEEGSKGSVVFQVFADGVKIYDSGTMTGSSTTKQLNLNVSGVKQLTLNVTDAGDGIDYDHADWAAVRVVPVPAGTPTPPSNLSAATGAAHQIKISWTDNSTNETGFKIDRATDSAFTKNLVTLTAPANNGSAATFTDSGLVGGATYFYRVRATNAAGDSASSNVASAVAGSVTTYLSDLQWVSATNGWGPVEKNTSNGSSGAGDGRTITLNGVTYAKGLGAHANSQIVYNLNGAYSSFLSDIGIDDEEGSKGSVVFQVFADGVKIYDSALMTGSSATKSVNLNVFGVNQLTLTVTDSGDGIDYDHADWAGARLIG